MYNLGFLTIFVSFCSILKNYKNNILILLSLELFFIGLTLLFLHSSFYLDDFDGLLSSLFLLALAATESAIGLTILICSRKD